MRLQLTIVAAVLLTSASARAQTAFSSKVQVYADDDHTTVVSPVVQAQADVSDSTNISATYLADVITSASIDVVSQASKQTVRDTRHQVSAGASHTFDTLVVHGGYTFATENDYTSHSLSASLEDGFDDKNTTLALGYALSINDVGRAGDHNFEKELDVHDLTLSWTQVINKKTVAQLVYEVGLASGYQASAYRFVPVADDAGMPMYWVPETDPDTRWRHAVVGGLNLMLSKASVVQADYRLYHDTWGITSHTVGLRWIEDVSDKMQLRLRSRLYAQNGASFYQARYTEVATYMAIDRELSPLWSETLGAKLTYALSDRLEGEAKLDAFYYAYSDFPLLASRLGANVGLGLQLTY